MDLIKLRSTGSKLQHDTAKFGKLNPSQHHDQSQSKYLSFIYLQYKKNYKKAFNLSETIKFLFFFSILKV